MRTKNYLLTLICTLLLTATGFSQIQFWTEDFEGTGPSMGGGTRSVGPGATAYPAAPPHSRYFKQTTLADINDASPFFQGVGGTQCWAAEDMDGAVDGTPNSQSSENWVRWAGISITGKTGLSFTGKFATTFSTVWDHQTSSGISPTNLADYIVMQYELNGSGTWVTFLSFQPNVPGSNSCGLSVDSNFDGTGDGTVLNNTLTDFTASIPVTGTTLAIRCMVSTNAQNEEIAFDDFRMYETPACTAPTITANPPNRAICAGNNTTFTASATGATAYQWQVNTGSGFTDLTNGAPYSGVTTNTLTITGATAGMNGYLYRAVAINGVASCFTNSNSGTLSISNITASTAQANVSCFNGSNGAAAVSPSGGIGSYTYSWSPSGGTASVATGLTAGSYTVTITDAISCQTTRNFTITQPPTAVSASAVVTNVACNGANTGAINLTPSGGTPGYFINWGGGVFTEDRSSLTAGTYTVTVEDANGCPANYSYTITQPPALSGSIIVTNVACNGGNTGAIDLTPSGGQPGYTYNWGGGVTTQDRTSLTAGTYSVTITDANSCTATVNATLTQPPAAVSGTTVVTNVACFGGNTGAINLTPTGGTGPYTFNWLPSGPTTEDRTNLVQGTYQVQITDANGCTGTVSATVTQPPAAVSGTTVVTNVACFGGNTGAINLTPTGGTGPYTFNWLPSGPTTEDRTNLIEGTYQVQITDANGCVGTVSATVTQPPAVVSGTTVVTNVACFGGNTGAINLTPTGGTGPYTYNWLPSGPTTEDRTNLIEGTYQVQITDANGCVGTVSATVTQPPAAVSGTTVVTNVACFGGNNGAINLTPAGGTGPYTFNWVGGVTTEDRTSLAQGTYTVTITDANGCTGSASATITEPTAVSGSTVVTNVACFGGNNGAINLTPAGGTGPYTFNWLPSGPTTEDRTSLAAGSYSVQITDANACTGTVTVTVTEPSAPVSGTTVVTNVSCLNGSNGSINLTPTGGTGPYTFDWGGGVTTEDRTGLAEGTYTVTITDNNGCQATVSATLTQPTASVSGTTVVTDAACFNGSNGTINLTPAGGTTPYTFNWGSGVTTEDRTGLAAGTYTVTITDNNGCEATVTATVGQPASAVSGTTTVTDATCFGGNNGAIDLTPAGGTAPYTFNWGGGITTEDRTGLTAGTYTVTITDANACEATVTATVAEPATVSGTIALTNVSCFGGNDGAINLTPAGGTAPYTFDWGGGITTEDRTGLAEGTYTVTITDNNGCTGTVTVSVTEPASPVSGTTVVTNVSCFGGNDGAINLTPAGGTAPYTFDWGGGITTEDRTGLAEGTYTVTITDNNACQATVTATVAQPAAAVSGTTVVTDVSCFNGSNGAIDLTPAGGTAPYTFDWGGGITTEDRTGLTDGTYTVTITDNNGCQEMVTATIAEPASAVSGTTTVTDVSCFGGNNGAIDLTAAGGVGPYTYDWGSGTTEDLSSLTAGTYTVTITDANGCEAMVSATVNEPVTAVSVTAVITDASCFGGTNGAIDITAAGGTPGYTYDWGGGITTEDRTAIAAGTYTVTVTDASGCMVTGSFTVAEPSAPVSGTAVITDVSCFSGANGAIDLTPEGGTPGYTFDWGGGITTEDRTGLAEGTYTVTITDANGCAATTTFTVAQPSELIASISSQTDVACNGGTDGAATAGVTGGTSPYDYSWSPAGGTDATASGLAPGTYTVTVTDANGCTASATATITEPTAISVTLDTQSDVSCFGGANGAATVSATGGTGTHDYAWSPTGGNAATASGLEAGTYTVTVTDANNCTATLSVTITQPDELIVTAASQTNAGCFGSNDGAASINPATGGTAPYTYDWAPGTPNGDGTTDVTGLTSGTYTVITTDANGCEASTTFEITQPDEIVTNLTVTACDSYDMNGTIYDTSGVYTVVETAANGCDSTIVLDLTINHPATSSMTVSACDSYTLNGETFTASGTYTQLLTTTGGCDSTLTLNLTITATPTVSITQTAAMTLEATSTGTSYQWINCNTGEEVPGATNATFVATENGSYAVTVANGTCETTSSCIVVDEASLDEYAGISIAIAPNPATDQFVVSMTGTNRAAVMVYDAQGKLVLNIGEAASGEAISLTGVQRGVYMVHVITSGGTYTERLIKH